MKTYLKKQSLIQISAIIFCINLISVAYAQVGTLVQRDTVPVPAGIGVGVDVDCVGNVYYTNYSNCDNHLYRMDKDANLLSTVLMVDSSGAPVSVGAISWDSNRDMIWGGSQCTFSPTRIYLIDPVTGIAQYKFDAHTPGNYLDDGIAYDFTDNSLWITPDVSAFLDHFKDDGTYLGTLYPSIPSSVCGGTCNISGVVVGQGDMLYLGLDGAGKIVQIRKSDGSYISSFSSPGGRDEDLACDNVNFLPKLVLWSKDAYNNTIDAIEVTPETCKCSEVLNVQDNANGSVSVYFNPFENNLTVKTGTPIKNAWLEILNAPGAIVYSQHFESLGDQSISISLSPGIYFVQIRAEERVWTQKVMIGK